MKAFSRCFFGVALLASGAAHPEPAVMALGSNSLSISPDGRFVTFVSEPRTDFELGDELKSRVLHIQDTADGKLLSIEVQAFHPAGVFPSWSPDSLYLAFYARDEDEKDRLMIWDATTRAIIYRSDRIACPNGCFLDTPRWSPDGRTASFVSRRMAPGTNEVVPSVWEQRWALEAELRGIKPAPGGMTVLTSPAAARTRGRGTHDVYARASSRAQRIDVDLVSVRLPAFTERIEATAQNIFDLMYSSDGKTVVITSSGNRPPEAGGGFGPAFYLLRGPGAGSAGQEAGDVQSGPVDDEGRPLRLIAWAGPMYSAQAASLSPSGKHLAYTTAGLEDSTGDAFMVDLMSGATVNVTGHIQLPEDKPCPVFDDEMNRRFYGRFGVGAASGNAPVWSENGEEIFLLRPALRDDVAIPVRFELWRVSAKAARRIDTGARWSFIGFAGCDAPNKSCVVNGRFLILRARDLKNRTHALIAVDVRDDSVEVLHDLGDFPVGETLRASDELTARPWLALRAARRSGSAVGVIETFRQAPDLWLVRPGRVPARALKVLNTSLPEAPERYQTLTWTTPDGRILRGALITPTRAEKEKLPLIVWLYPAYAGNYSRSYLIYRGADRWRLWLATNRFAVLIPEVPEPLPGPASRCASFSQSVIGALDAAARIASVDADRAGLFGESAGVPLVSCVITRTDRFKAAVAVAGTWNYIRLCLPSFANPGDKGTRWCSGQSGIPEPIWKSPGRYVEETALFHADKVHTPLLIVYGKQEFDHFAAQSSLEMYSALVQLDREVELVAYDGVGHGASFHPDFVPRMMNWFDMYLCNATRSDRSP